MRSLPFGRGLLGAGSASLLVLGALALACSTDDPAGVTPGAPDAGDDAPQATGDGSAATPSGATLALARTALWVPAGGRATVAFTVGRGSVGGKLLVHVADLPAGITAADVEVPDGAAGGTIVFEAGPTTAYGTSAEVSVGLTAANVEQDRRSIRVGVSGEPGAPDHSFGTLGFATPSIPHQVYPAAIAIYPPASEHAGKILVAGLVPLTPTRVEITLVRLLETGELDVTFGDPAPADAGTADRLGYTLFDPGANDAAHPNAIAGMALDAAGRIVVASTRRGGGQCLVELGRWTADGKVDDAFTRFSGPLNPGPYCGTPTDVVLVPAGAITVVATYPIGEDSTPPAVDGQIETVVQRFDAETGERDEETFHLLLDPDGETSTRLRGAASVEGGGLLLAGEQCAGGWSSSVFDCRSAIVRLTTAGALDPSFGTSGVTAFELPELAADPSEGFQRITVAADGRVVAGGRAEGAADGTLARLGPSGQPALFGTGGALRRNLLADAVTEEIRRPLFDGEGRVVFFGNATRDASVYAVHGRTLGDGAPDPAYALAGVESTLGTGGDAALGSDDRLYVATAVPGEAGRVRLAVIRYWP